MHRLLVALLSAFDALLASAVGIAVALAPLTLVWVFAFGDAADWGALWAASGSIWLLGNLVPHTLTIPGDYAAAAGIDAAAATFTLSLAPLAFAAFTVVFAARSGARAAGAGAWITGVATGALVVAAVAGTVVMTTANDVARPIAWQGILFPAALYAGAALAGALVAAWRDGDDGLVDELRARLDDVSEDWAAVPGLIARGAGIALAGLAGAAAVAIAAAVFVRGGQVVALFESANVDALGATVLTLGQLAYLPTLTVWALSWLAGPGFAVGIGSAVSPAGTQLGLMPGIPVLGLLPEQASPWLLLVLLVPVAAGAVAGWAVRSRMVAARAPRQSTAAPAALAGLIPIDRPAVGGVEPFAPRLVVAGGIAVLAALGAGALAAAASGSIGPGRLAEVGPAAGPVALSVGLEVLVGAAILLLGPAGAARRPKHGVAGPRPEKRVRDDRGAADPDSTTPSNANAVGFEGFDDHVVPPTREPVEPVDPATLGTGRPAPLPPVD